MVYTFLYPCDPFNSKEIEPTFKEEYEEMKKNFDIILIDTDNLENKKPYSKIENNCIYRGWMLTAEQYQQLEDNCHGFLVTNTKSYLSNHHLPNWYHYLSELTPKSYITTQNEAADLFNKIGWEKAFIKDYVKSLKTGKGSIVNSPQDVIRAIEDMLKYRGFIEEGIVLREVKEFIQQTEIRFFVLNGDLLSPINKEMISVNQLEIIEKVMKKKQDSFFYSIDLIEDKEGKVWLVEIGDGQVSDCVGWDVKIFADSFKKLNNVLINEVTKIKI